MLLHLAASFFNGSKFAKFVPANNIRPVHEGSQVKKGMVDFMKRQDIAVYREIQKSAEMAIKAIDTITDKVYDNQFSMQLQKQSGKYGEIRQRACERLLQENVEPYRTGQIENMMLAGGIHYNTLLNNSTGHLAELLIRGSNKGVLELNKALNHNHDAGELSVSLAKELIAFENRNIERLTKYL